MSEQTTSDGEKPPQREGSRILKRAAKTFITLALIWFFVIPLIPGFRDAIDRLTDVAPGYLICGLGLQISALFSYSMLTRAALTEEGHKFPIFRLFRIQLSTRALGSVMPVGNAASSALGYRLLTLSGVSGPDAGFALATAGVGSAVVLNIMLWIALIVSIPLRGVNAGYGLAALVGVILMLVAALLVFGLMEGQGRAERAVRAIAKNLRFNPDRAAEVLNHLGSRLESLAKNRHLMRRVVFWAALNWLLDAASLWVFLRAFGGSIAFDGLLVAFGLANIIAVVPMTPGGLGIVEGLYIPTLVGFGLTKSTATVGVYLYRIAQYFMPIALGGLAYLSLRMGPLSIARHTRLSKLRDVAIEEAERRQSRVDWIETYAPRDITSEVSKFDRPG
jgi:hypothetical protein